MNRKIMCIVSKMGFMISTAAGVCDDDDNQTARTKKSSAYCVCFVGDDNC